MRHPRFHWHILQKYNRNFLRSGGIHIGPEAMSSSGNAREEPNATMKPERRATQVKEV